MNEYVAKLARENRELKEAVEAAFKEGVSLGKKIQFWDERIKVDDLWLRSDARAWGKK